MKVPQNFSFFLENKRKVCDDREIWIFFSHLVIIAFLFDGKRYRYTTMQLMFQLTHEVRGDEYKREFFRVTLDFWGGPQLHFGGDSLLTFGGSLGVSYKFLRGPTENFEGIPR